MTNYKEIIRLHSLGLNKTRIAESCGYARSTVITALHKDEENGLSWNAVKNLSSEEVACKLYPATSMGQQYSIAERHLDREQILRLASCSYIQEARNVIILGATGAGKTFLACSLGVAANRNFYAARYLRLPDLLVEIAVARRDGTYREYMKQLKKVKLLILDGLLYPLKEAEARDVLELVEARNKVASTIFCSQYGTSEWHENLYDSTLADAICDWIIYNAYTVQIEGESMRKRMGMTE